MQTAVRQPEIAQRYAEALRDYMASESQRLGATEPVRPGHRVPFQWPPHPVSYNYHVLASDWRGSMTATFAGETYEVALAHTPYGVFGRIETLWAEAMGDDEAAMLENLARTLEPFFERQRVIAATLGLKDRYKRPLSELASVDLLKALYCSDRDVANDARTILETRPNKPDLLPALLAILRDEKHPGRRSAQWCVLDLFEDLPLYCVDLNDELDAIAAMKQLIWSAPDDFARTTFKAGVAIGGHLPDDYGATALLECLKAPSKFGRRSAIHGLFHVVEWQPHQRDRVVAALRDVAATESEPALKDFATWMAKDIASESGDHIPEPIFDEEA